jgi:dipeptidyl aminopeptidase/acylaminoacyl peptidase
MRREPKIVVRTLPGFGTIYQPGNEGRYPGILLLHGSEGGLSAWSHSNSVLLAAHGFLAYPHAYSIGGNSWNAGSIKDIALEKTIDALAALLALDSCSGKVALYGISRGAEHALLLTSLMVRDGVEPLPSAVAVHAPPDVICGAFDARIWRDNGDPGFRAWDPAERAWTWRGNSDALKPTTPIEIERYEGPIFISHGTADRVWSVEMTRRLEARLLEHSRRPEVHYYDGQPHGLIGEALNLHLGRLTAFFDRHLFHIDAL